MDLPQPPPDLTASEVPDTGAHPDALADAPGQAVTGCTREWGVRSGVHVIICESEDAAKALTGDSGGEIVTRVTYSCSW